MEMKIEERKELQLNKRKEKEEAKERPREEKKLQKGNTWLLQLTRRIKKERNEREVKKSQIKGLLQLTRRMKEKESHGLAREKERKR